MSMSIIIGLRSGFIPFNHYKHLANQIDSPNCLCGESETVHHYLLQCPNYEEEREGFRTELYFATRSLNLDLDTLLHLVKTINTTQQKITYFNYWENSSTKPNDFNYALVSTTYKLFSATQKYKRDSYQRVLIYTRATLNYKCYIVS